MKGLLWKFGKDKEMGPFKAAEQLLSPGSHKMNVRDRVELVFQDMDLVPLLVQVRFPKGGSCSRLSCTYSRKYPDMVI